MWTGTMPLISTALATKSIKDVDFTQLRSLRVKNLKPSASEPIDGIPQMFLGNAAPPWNIPQLWRKAIITAVPKSVGSNRVKYWRVGKFTHAAEQHDSYLGFYCHHTYDTLLMSTAKAINCGKSVDVIHFDLSKAFDKVCHTKLFAKLDPWQDAYLAVIISQWQESR
ncbi:hypothetical protein OSTOST_25127 [Ostertagia ostertagi]